MIFAHDTEYDLGAVVALVNTTHSDGRDELVAVDALEEFARSWGWTGGRPADVSDLRAVRVLRTRLRTLWDLDSDRAAHLLNGLLREGSALPQLVNHDGWGYHLHATPPDATLADRLAVDAAMALTDVVRHGELGRLATCAAEGCEDVLIDLSKNRSRRFCSASCANRTNVAAYRARQASRPG